VCNFSLCLCTFSAYVKCAKSIGRIIVIHLRALVKGIKMFVQRIKRALFAVHHHRGSKTGAAAAVSLALTKNNEK